MIKTVRPKTLPGLLIGYRKLESGGVSAIYYLINEEGDGKFIYLDDLDAPIEFIPIDKPKVIETLENFTDYNDNILEDKIIKLFISMDLSAVRVQDVGGVKRLLIWGQFSKFSDGEITEEEFEELTELFLF